VTLNPVKRHREHCREARASMSDYLDGELDEQAARRLRRHVRWCPSCQRFLASFNRTVEGLRKLGQQPGDDLTAAAG
jgi:anti-sigma factor RsiW